MDEWMHKRLKHETVTRETYKRTIIQHNILKVLILN